MGFNDFPCYLGVILPSAIHHTRVGGVDWFEYLESISVSPVQEELSNKDVLINMQHKCSKEKMHSIFKWFNKCIDERRQQYPLQYQKGLLIVLHKDDWKLYKDRGFTSDLQMCEDRPNETNRIPNDCYCFYVERSNLERLADRLDSHYSMHYSFGAKCPLHVKGTQSSPHGHSPSPHGHSPSPHGHSPSPHDHHTHHHHNHTTTQTTTHTSGSSPWSIDLSPFGINVKVTDNSISPTHSHPAPQQQPHHHHHPAPQQQPHHYPTPTPPRPLPVNVDSFDCYLGFVLPSTLHHTTVRGIDWFKHFEAFNMKPKHHHLTGSRDPSQNDILLSIIHQNERKQIGNAINWIHECINDRFTQYPTEYQNGLVIVMLRPDWKLWKSQMAPYEKSLSEKCSDHDRNRIGHEYVGRYITLHNLNRFVTALSSHYSNNYQIGTKPAIDRPDPNPSTHKKSRGHHHNHHNQAPQPYNPHAAPSPHGHPAPYNPHAAPSPHGHPAPSPHGHPAPSPHGHPAPSPHGHPAPSPHGHPAPYNPHTAPAPYNPHAAPTPPAPYNPHGASAPAPYGAPVHGHPAQYNPHTAPTHGYPAPKGPSPY